MNRVRLDHTRARMGARSRSLAITGTQAYRDEFTIAITDASGWYRSWATRRVTFTIDDPLQAHVDQLGKYTDADMHSTCRH